MTAYEHFEQYGAHENVAPTKDFDINFYIAAKVNALNSVNYEGKTWTMESVLQAFNEAGVSAWEHYKQFGSSEGLAPNADFDSDKYYLAKVSQLNATGYEGRTDWTVDEVKQAFADAGITALEHYAEFGGAESISTYATGTADFTTVDQKVNIQNVVDNSDFDANGAGIKSYTLANALAAKADGTLPESYNMSNDFAAGEITVAQQGQIDGIIKGALNGDTFADASITYSLNDSYANLLTASASVVTGATSRVLTDTIDAKFFTEGAIESSAILKISGLTNVNDIAFQISGADKSDYLVMTKMGGDFGKDGKADIAIAQLGGGNGADFLRGDTEGNILFGGSITEKDAKGVYAESQDSIASGMKLHDNFYNVFVNGGNPSDQWIAKDVVSKYFDGHNVLDGDAGENTLVASNAADTFLIQMGGKNDSVGVTKETPGNNTIHQFKVGQDSLFIMDQSDRDGGDKDSNGDPTNTGLGTALTFSGGWTKAQVNDTNNVILSWSSANALTVTIKSDFLNAQHNIGSDASSWASTSSDVVINLVGVQNADIDTTTAADLFGITA